MRTCAWPPRRHSQTVRSECVARRRLIAPSKSHPSLASSLGDPYRKVQSYSNSTKTRRITIYKSTRIRADDTVPFYLNRLRMAGPSLQSRSSHALSLGAFNGCYNCIHTISKTQRIKRTNLHKFMPLQFPRLPHSEIKQQGRGEHHGLGGSSRLRAPRWCLCPMQKVCWGSSASWACSSSGTRWLHRRRTADDWTDHRG